MPASPPLPRCVSLPAHSPQASMVAPSAGAPPDVARQLDGAIAADSSICLLSPADNRLAYRGYDVADLAHPVSSYLDKSLLDDIAIQKRAGNTTMESGGGAIHRSALRTSWNRAKAFPQTLTNVLSMTNYQDVAKQLPAPGTRPSPNQYLRR